MEQFRYLVNGVFHYPINAGTESYDYDKDDDQTTQRTLKMTTPLIFSYGDFDIKQFDFCDEMTLLVQKNCFGTWEDYFTGYFAISEGSQDDLRCLFSVTPRNQDVSTVFSDTPVNFLQQSTRVTATTSSRTYPNGVPFAVFLTYIIKQANININQVVSDFFQINPVNVGYSLPGETNYYTHMIAFALSDIQEPVPSNPATIELISFKDLMADLYALFRVDWRVDANKNLRIEHTSFFKSNANFFLTDSKFKPYLKGKDQFTYDIKNSVKYESWVQFNSKQYANINYDTYGQINKTQNTTTYQTSKIAADYAKIRYWGGSSSSDGIFLMACDASNVMLEYAGQNIRLIPRELAQHVTNYDRPGDYGLIESGVCIGIGSLVEIGIDRGGYNAKTKLPTKQQNEITVPICCSDNFDVNGNIITDVGAAIADKCTFNIKDSTVTLSLLYQNSSCNKFLPNQLQGLRLWLKAGTGITLTSGKVSQWADQSGHNLHATQATAIQRPTYNSTTKEVTFTATDGIYTDGTFLKTPSFTVMPNKRGTIIILYAADNGTTIPVLSTYSGAANYLGIIHQPQLFWAGISSVAINDIASGHGLYEYIRDSDTNLSFYENNGISITDKYTIPNIQIAANPLSIGFDPIIGLQQNGILKVKEVIMYDRVLTQQELYRIRFYLASTGIYSTYPLPHP